MNNLVDQRKIQGIYIVYNIFIDSIFTHLSKQYVLLLYYTDHIQRERDKKDLSFLRI